MALALDMTKRRKAVQRSFEDLQRCAEIYDDLNAFLFRWSKKRGSWMHCPIH